MPMICKSLVKSLLSAMLVVCLDVGRADRGWRQLDAARDIVLRRIPRWRRAHCRRDDEASLSLRDTGHWPTRTAHCYCRTYTSTVLEWM